MQTTIVLTQPIVIMNSSPDTTVSCDGAVVFLTICSSRVDISPKNKTQSEIANYISTITNKFKEAGWSVSINNTVTSFSTDATKSFNAVDCRMFVTYVPLNQINKEAASYIQQLKCESHLIP